MPERITPEPIEEVMAQRYLDYSVSVIRGRALPDARDGLKPGNRRAIYSMRELGLTPGKSTRKCALVVGHTLGHYHPHGDMATYAALVRMGQEFVHQHPLVEIQGNSGSINDPHSFAAMRYTEARLGQMAEYLISDMPYNCVPMTSNYDGSTEEPEVLPASVPYLLLGSNIGIAVGFVTNALPYNLEECLTATIALIENPETSDEDILEIVKGPDFPTGGVIIEREGLVNAIRTGKGLTKVRARYETTESDIIVTELPYLVSKTSIIDSIADARKKRDDGNGGKPPMVPEVADVKDLSDSKGVKIKIRVRRGENPDVIMMKLLKHTRLQETLKISYTCILDGRPVELSFRQAVEQWHLFRRDTLMQKHTFLADKARRRIHLLEGIIIVCSDPELAIQLIKDSSTRVQACKKLRKAFKIDDEQAQYVLEMKVYRFSKDEVLKSEKELEDQQETLAFHDKRLKSIKVIDNDIIVELEGVIKKHGCPRKTEVLSAWKADSLSDDDMVEEERVTIYRSRGGYIKRVPPDLQANAQKRGGKGRKIGVGKNDFIAEVISCSTHDDIFFVTSFGKIHVIKAYKVPEAPLDKQGTHINTLIVAAKGETVTASFPVKEYDGRYQILVVTKKGYCKRTPLSEYSSCKRQGGLLTCKLRDGDHVVTCKLLDSEQDANLIVTTTVGKAVHFGMEEVPVLKRDTMGNKSVSRDMDVVTADVLTSLEGSLLLVSDDGQGKRVELEDFPVTHRNTSGVIAVKFKGKKTFLAGAAIVQEEDEAIVVSSSKLIRVKVGDVRILRRPAYGFRMINLGDGDRVESVNRIIAE